LAGDELDGAGPRSRYAFSGKFARAIRRTPQGCTSASAVAADATIIQFGSSASKSSAGKLRSRSAKVRAFDDSLNCAEERLICDLAMDLRQQIELSPHPSSPVGF